MGTDEALEFMARFDRVIAAKGKKVAETVREGSAIDTRAVQPLSLGPTGNLRAPAIQVGKTLLIGFNEDVYNEHLVK